MGENREQLAAKLRKAKEELKTAGPIHKRDLQKHIWRMQREINDYDRFRKAVS